MFVRLCGYCFDSSSGHILGIHILYILLHTLTAKKKRQKKNEKKRKQFAKEISIRNGIEQIDLLVND